MELLKTVKMADSQGQVVELFEGNYNPHIAVDWVTDEDGNLFEIVEVKNVQTRER